MKSAPPASSAPPSAPAPTDPALLSGQPWAPPRPPIAPRRARRTRRAVVLACAAVIAAGAVAWWHHEPDLPTYAHPNLAPAPSLLYSLVPTDPSRFGVVVHDRARAQPGVNLFDPVHDSRTFLLDMDGRIVHAWSYVEQPGGPPMTGGGPGSRWMTLDLLADGHLVLVRDQDLVMRLGWDSRLLAWARLPAHHDLTAAPDGTFYTLVNEFRDHANRSVLFARLAHLSADFREIDGMSTYDLRERFPNTALEEQFARTSSRPFSDPRMNDYFHENSVSVIGPTALHTAADSTGTWRPGNLLLCLRNIDRVLVLDARTYAVLWEWGADVIEGPHHPTLLPNGHLLVFDNGVRRHASRVIELDPITRTIAWQYPAPGSGHTLFTEGGGSAQRLANGNTLICESDNGRAIEVTPAGEIVWEYLHPIVAPGATDPTTWRRARIYRMLRYPVDRVAAPMANPGPLPGPQPPWWR